MEEEDTARAMIDALHAADPVPAGCRLDHARGLLVEGTFHPSSRARTISKAAILSNGDQPALVRLSSFGADAMVDEDASGSDPRGIAVSIGDPATLVLLGHSAEGFPAASATAFVAFLQGLARDAAVRRAADAGVGRERSEGVPAASHPPSSTKSFAELTYHTLHPYILVDGVGTKRTGRLRIAGGPAGHDNPRDGGRDRLDTELRSRLLAGEVELSLRFQPAPDGADVADISRPWPRTDTIELGRISLQRIAQDQSAQSRLAFDPATLPDGIAFAGDAMIRARLAAYRLAFERRLESAAP